MDSMKHHLCISVNGLVLSLADTQIVPNTVAEGTILTYPSFPVEVNEMREEGHLERIPPKFQ